MKNLLVTAMLLSVFGAFAQCPPQITCPGNITVSNDPGKCSAVVNYNTPNGIDTCLSGSQTFNYSGVIDTFIVPLGLGTITIEAWGAQGGTGNWSPPGNAGGLGAYIKGDVTVSGGDTILILVGEMGETQGTGGGGGGSFTATTGNTPLIIAGGGGGGTFDEQGVDASTTQNGTMDSQNAVNGGTGGAGGSVCGTNQNDGGGGGGFLTDGADARTTGAGGFGGKAFVNGGAGAPRGINGTCTGCAGGFGGGGSGSCNTVGGGGGGGYSGGAGGKHYNNCISNATRSGGGGGGSFNAGSNTADSAGVRTGNGLVRITWNGAGVTTNQIAGLPSGSTFPVGTTNNTFVTSNSAGSDTCSFTVTVNDTNATPSIGALSQDTICTSSGTITLPAGSPAGGVYSGTGVTGNMFDPAAAEQGNHWIYYTDTSGCNHADSVMITVVWCAGLEEQRTVNNIKVTPNPSNGIYQLNAGEGITASYTVADVTGRIVVSETTFRRSSEIDITTEENGVYIVTLRVANASRTIRLIKN